MKNSVLASAAVAAVLGVAGCSSSHNGAAGASISAGAGSAGASVSVSANPSTLLPSSPASTGSVTATACQNLKKTVASIPSKLIDAATKASPAQQMQQTLSTIDQTLMSEAGGAGNQLKTAVSDYVNQLKQVVSSAENGKAPDLSKLSTTQLDNICSGS